jgi:hypothetical protein
VDRQGEEASVHPEEFALKSVDSSVQRADLLELTKKRVDRIE